MYSTEPLETNREEKSKTTEMPGEEEIGRTSAISYSTQISFHYVFRRFVSLFAPLLLCAFAFVWMQQAQGTVPARCFCMSS